jgi:hypothetical protein
VSCTGYEFGDLTQVDPGHFSYLFLINFFSISFFIVRLIEIKFHNLFQFTLYGIILVSCLGL